MFPTMVKYSPAFKALGRFIVFKRCDMFEKSDDLEVALFFVQPDALYCFSRTSISSPRFSSPESSVKPASGFGMKFRAGLNRC